VAIVEELVHKQTRLKLELVWLFQQLHHATQQLVQTQQLAFAAVMESTIALDVLFSKQVQITRMTSEDVLVLMLPLPNKSHSLWQHLLSLLHSSLSNGINSPSLKHNGHNSRKPIFEQQYKKTTRTTCETKDPKMQLCAVIILCLAVSSFASRARQLQQPFLTEISTQHEFDSVTAKTDFSSNFGPSTKFLIDIRARDKPQLFIFNANHPNEAKRYHFDFAQQFVPGMNLSLDDFTKDTYFTQEKSFYAGILQLYTHQKQRVLGFQFYPQDIMAEQTILTAAKIMKAKVRVPGLQLAFVATGNQQTFATVKKEIEKLNIKLLTLQEILGDVTYQALVQGETFGYLRLKPKEDETSPKDIVILDVLPLYLSVVSGVITTQFQDPNSHVSLKSRERGTPDCFYKDVTTDRSIMDLVDKPVRMVVTIDKVVITAATKEQVAEFHKPKSKNPIIMNYDGKSKKILHYDQMCPKSGKDFKQAKVCLDKKSTYGAKGANLAFLAHGTALGRVSDDNSPSFHMGYDLSPHGFGIPFRFYDDVINHKDNKKLKKKIEKLQEQMNNNELERKEINEATEEIRELFMEATIPKENLKAVEEAIEELVEDYDEEDIKLKFRSSASAEDIEGFDGAGLYNSCSVKVNSKKKGKCKWDEEEDDVSPKRTDCAILGVYASLYNARAVEERQFAAIQGGIAMAIAVVPAYNTLSKVAANSVVVSKIQEATQGDLSGITIASQVGNELVTNPTPGTLAEFTWAIQAIPDEQMTFTTARFASPVPGQPALTKRVLDDDQLTVTAKIVQRLETAYCAAKAGELTEECLDLPFIPTSEKKVALDFEFKYLEDHTFVVKQIREFSG
jgi:uncharacterized protein (UPF0147 family)